MNKKEIGKILKMFREQRGLSLYKIAQKGGIRQEQAKVIEEGSANYTIDSFIGYIIGSDLYMYFAEKESENNIGDLINKMKNE